MIDIILQSGWSHDRLPEKSGHLRQNSDPASLMLQYKCSRGMLSFVLIFNEVVPQSDLARNHVLGQMQAARFSFLKNSQYRKAQDFYNKYTPTNQYLPKQDTHSKHSKRTRKTRDCQKTEMPWPGPGTRQRESVCFELTPLSHPSSFTEMYTNTEKLDINTNWLSQNQEIPRDVPSFSKFSHMFQFSKRYVCFKDWRQLIVLWNADISGFFFYIISFLSFPFLT